MLNAPKLITIKVLKLGRKNPTFELRVSYHFVERAKERGIDISALYYIATFYISHKTRRKFTRLTPGETYSIFLAHFFYSKKRITKYYASPVALDGKKEYQATIFQIGRKDYLIIASSQKKVG